MSFNSSTKTSIIDDRIIDDASNNSLDNSLDSNQTNYTLTINREDSVNLPILQRNSFLEKIDKQYFLLTILYICIFVFLICFVVFSLSVK